MIQDSEANEKKVEANAKEKDHPIQVQQPKSKKANNYERIYAKIVQM